MMHKVGRLCRRQIYRSRKDEMLGAVELHRVCERCGDKGM